ncbi:MAG: hypothetical protein IKW74_06675 [Thermoguttaceae bacterium]|nr:hypothetical protein [Thermoguttaceae bacterium]
MKKRSLKHLLQGMVAVTVVGGLFCFSSLLPVTAQDQAGSDSWVAVDNLGRELPTYEEVGPVRQDKYIAMFYFLCLGRHGDAGPYNITEILKKDPDAFNKPDAPYWGAIGAPHHWGESLFNFYVGEDESVLRKHAQMLGDAGVDVIVFDVTNQLTYPESYRPLFKVFSEMQKAGNRVPKVAFLCPFWTLRKVVNELWRDVYSKNYYQDVWFYWKGKPLILADPDLILPDVFTVDTKDRVPIEMAVGESMGQSFETTQGIKELIAYLPTWTEKNSKALLILRKDGPRGEIVYQREQEKVPDTHGCFLKFPEVIPAGKYYIEVKNLQGRLGWWAHQKNSERVARIPEIKWGTAYKNDKAVDYVFSVGITSINEETQKILDFFTFRSPQPDYFIGPVKANQWSWLEVFPQHEFYDENGKTEQMSVGVAQNALDGKLAVLSNPKSHGRSFHDGKEPDPKDQDTSGRNFQEQWKRALEVDPEIVFVTGWNEWIAGRFPQNGSFYGMTPASFVDQADQEHSRDIEPMMGGHEDNYYYQAISYFRRFKGMKPTPKTRTAPITVDGEFGDWQTVSPEYTDTVGDPVHRDERGWGKGVRYVNETGRNDIVSAKVSSDGDNLYFYVKTGDTLTSEQDPNWMLLLIDADENKETGWLGYDFVLNRTPETVGCIEKYNDKSGEWELSQKLEQFRIGEKELELSIPRSLLGYEAEVKPFQFKWADNIQQTGHWYDFTLNGDAAPNDRYQYRYIPENK